MNQQAKIFHPPKNQEVVNRVIVVGAGIAGLTVANALRAADIDVIVLDARERIGGRIHSLDLEDGKVDAGASWIHQPDANPLTMLAQASEIPQKDFALTTIFATMRLLDVHGSVLDDAERDWMLALAGDIADDVVDVALSSEGLASIDLIVDDVLARGGISGST